MQQEIVKMCRPCAEKLKSEGKARIIHSCRDKDECYACHRRKYVYECELLQTDKPVILPIKSKWFFSIVSGEKKEEYRDIKPYWTKRFKIEDYIYPDNTETHPHKLEFVSCDKEVIFKNGYTANAPMCRCKVKIHKGYGKTEWGAEPNKEYYVLDILKIIEVKNYKSQKGMC